jgi:hypothetical protein
VRSLAARLVGAREPHEVAFLANTSDGLSVVAAGLDWREGDNVVGANCEFPSNVYPWMRLASHGVELRMAEERDGRVDPDQLLALVDERTRVVALSWVQFASGFRSDLGRIGRACASRGVLFVVDAIQGLGASGSTSSATRSTCSRPRPTSGCAAARGSACSTSRTASSSGSSLRASGGRRSRTGSSGRATTSRTARARGGSSAAR